MSLAQLYAIPIDKTVFAIYVLFIFSNAITLIRFLTSFIIFSQVFIDKLNSLPISSKSFLSGLPSPKTVTSRSNLSIVLVMS